MGELALPFTWAVWESWPQWHWCRRDRSPNHLTTTQAQIQDSEIAHPNIYPTCGLLEHVKGVVLKNQSCRISVIRGVSVRLEYWLCSKSPKASNQIKDSLQWSFCKKSSLDKRMYCVAQLRFHREIIIIIIYLIFKFNFNFIFFWKEDTRVEGRYGKTRKWVGLGCMMWNSQSIKIWRKRGCYRASLREILKEEFGSSDDICNQIPMYFQTNCLLLRVQPVLSPVEGHKISHICFHGLSKLSANTCYIDHGLLKILE